MRLSPVMMVSTMLLAAACQSKQKPAAPPPPPPQSVTIHARDYAFDAPAEIPAGLTTIHLVNDGPGLHHALFGLLAPGKTVADLIAGLKKTKTFPPWVTFVGGPNVPDPGKESEATLDLAPGNYVLICTLDMPGGMPHYMRGMYRPLTVTAAATDAASATAPKAVEPAADNQIALSDYVFQLGQPITAGTHTFRVVTAPGQPHEVLVVQLDSGKTAHDYVEWLPTMKGAAPGHEIGGTAAAVAGVVQTFTATFSPGNYLLISLWPDRKTGKAQYQEGMMKTIMVP